MAHGYENIFPIENAENLGCGVHLYGGDDRSTMYLRIGDSNKTLFYLFLHGVRYFRGSLAWRGINFQLGTDEECKDVLMRAGYIPEVASLIIERGYSKLYQINYLNSDPIQIIAANIERIDETDPLYKFRP